jgi:2-succinyl-6-hydroxy-2,4-cyclohexadiene-1-carboxylate synthase
MWMLLHGFTGAPASWSSVIAHAELEHAPVVPLLAGHGPDWREREVASFDEEITRLCALASTMPPPRYVGGYSLGARVAAGMLAIAPGLFEGAVLVGVHPGLDDEEARRARQAVDEGRATRLRAEGLDAFVADWEQQPLFSSQRTLPEEVRAKQREIRLHHDADGLARSLEVLGLGCMPRYADALSATRVPITLMAGAEDAKFRALGNDLAARNQETGCIIVEGAGHNLLLEAPDAVAEAMAGVERRAREGARR